MAQMKDARRKMEFQNGLERNFHMQSNENKELAP